MVKYSGRFVVEDKANNVKYLADLKFKWDLGDDLSLWLLSGDTNPVIASDRWMQIRDASAGVGSSRLGTTSPGQLGTGYYPGALHYKLRRMSDDNSTQFAWASGMTGFPAHWAVAGCGYVVDGGAAYSRWEGHGYVGGYGVNIGSPLPADGSEHDIDIVQDGAFLSLLIDGILKARHSISIYGNAPPNIGPIYHWWVGTKAIMFWTRHNAGQVSHYRVRDVKLGYVVGVKSF